ncbi:hypothetical protein C2S52_014113 [Perilla frutescens var. hirtella]|nr:hypothetical protein C2S52_014113 [Perilla frutescens var. hirtella]
MRACIKSIDARAWNTVQKAWTHPKTIDAEGDTIRTPPEEWTRSQNEDETFNDKAINAIQSSLDIQMFKLIRNCESTKEAWDILQQHCEGDVGIKESRHRILTTKFENMMMVEDETVGEYCNKLLEIANKCTDLGDPITNKRLVSKALQTLTPRFDMKVVAIDTATTTRCLDFTKLMNDLKTYEMEMNEKGGSKKKGIALTAGSTSKSTSPYDEYDDEDVEEISEMNPDYALLTKRLNTLIRANKGK